MSAEEQDTRSGGIQVIARAAELLRVLQAHPGGLSQAEIGERVGMARSTVSRILNALEDEGWWPRAGPGTLSAGPGDHADGHHGTAGCRHGDAPVLDGVVARAGRDGGLVDPGRGSGGRRGPGRAAAAAAGRERGGESFPLYCCANGKALLAALPPERQARALPSRLAPLTANTITDRAALRDELNRIRVDGVAYDREEQTEGICAVGAVLRGCRLSWWR